MNKIKNVLEQIKNKKQAPDALEYLTMLKSEMSGREMSPNDFNTYEKLGEMEHSLYRYNSLLKAGLTEDAEKEGEKFFSISQGPDGAIVLKGGISNCRYVWQTEKGACDACQALDGKEFETLDDVPERPHPNCKCDIVPIENKKEDDKKDDNESCDCYQKVLNMCDEIVFLDNEAIENLSTIDMLEMEATYWLNEIQQIKNQLYTSDIEYITGFAANIDDSTLENIVYDLIKYSEEARTVYDIFLQHKHEMENTKNSFDKYYHAKANCESAKLGEMHAHWAIAFSLFKELKDFYKKVFVQHQDAKKIFIDCMQDLKADFYGIIKSNELKPCSDSLQDIRDIFK